MNLSAVIKKMKSTDQIPGRQTVYQHGLSVRRHLDLIISHLRGTTKLSKAFIPSWLENINLNDLNSKDIKNLRHYALWHDLGKPFCQTKSPDH